MGGGEKHNRGWSLVFEDRTDESAVADGPPGRPNDGGGGEGATIIDQDISDEIQEALRQRYEAAKEAEDQSTDDFLLENVDVAKELDASSEPEHTVRSQRPNFDETPVLEILQTDPPDAPDVSDGPRTSPEEPAFSEHIETSTDDDDDDDELAPIDDLSAVELTRRAPIPYDLFAEQALPDVERPPPEITRRKATPRPRSKPRSEPRPAPEPLPEDALHEVPSAPHRSGSETMLDLGAQLGMAPGGREAGDDHDGPTVDDDDRRIHRETMEIPSSPNDEIDLLPFLDADDDDDKKKKSNVPIVFQKKRPSEGAKAEDIQRWATGADTAARTIPIVLAVFVIFGTITAIAMLFSTGGTKQEHIEMRFLSLQGPRHRAIRASDTPTRITVETVPDGVFVLFGSEILGKTPIVADLHIELDEAVGVELSGPYYEKWVGEVVRDSTGEYRIFVELKKK